MLPVDQMLHLRIDCPVNNVAMITPPDENENKLEDTSLSDIYRLTPYVSPSSLPGPLTDPL
jgi:osomolarity two-component system sensor histidine kinase TcsA